MREINPIHRFRSDEKHDAHVRILIVEDDVTYARFAQEMLQSVRSTRFELAHATSVHGAIERLGAVPDIVLLDLGLPDAQELEALTAGIAAAETRVEVVSAREQELAQRLMDQ
jgi:CheY-like chemotaxis protein